MVWLPTVKKFEHMFSWLDRIPECDGQADRQTDRWTDGQTSCHGIVRAMYRRRAVTEVGLHSAVSAASFNAYCLLPTAYRAMCSKRPSKYQ